MYNIADSVILLSSAEGWGLSLTEALVTGTPIIANTTGGMQDQMRFEGPKKEWFEPTPELPSNNRGTLKQHGEWAFPVYPTSRSIVGSPLTPYIWDDRCTPEDAADRIMELYEISPEERQKRGEAGRKWATNVEAGFTAEIMGERVIEACDTLFNTWAPREKYEVIKIEKGVCYMVDNHQAHEFTAVTDVVLISVFNPPLKGNETHDESGNYN
jgi:hypothetical protein